MQILTGHNSPETAYVVADYPYGFRLRCQIRYWIETKKHGQRFMSQTTNPKRDGIVWNKPKASTYDDVQVMYLDDNGHVQCAGFPLAYRDEAELDAFLETYGAGLQDEYAQKFIKHARAIFAARKCIKVEWRIGGESQPQAEVDAAMDTARRVYCAEMARQEADEREVPADQTGYTDLF
jgi:hypothetical protein